VVDQLGVSTVHPVEHADGDDASAPVRGDLILTPPALHDRKPTTRQSPRRREIPRWGNDCLNLASVSPDGNQNDLSTVAQDYLKVIWTAQEWSLEKVSTKMLAERIGVSASTASESIRKLADQGLVDHEKYGAVTLTDAGRSAALAMVRRHRLMETFLVRELGYSWDEVHDEAEVLEHAVSDRMLDRIDAKLGFPTRDPHGDPIPAADGRVPTPDARQLSVCRDGDTGTVARISDSDPEMLRYFDSVGISLDSRLKVLARRDFAGMISVAIESPANPAASGGDVNTTTVDLGSPAAQAIWVVA
jgi:DtxR family Mn-dependent transcriptional regulator